MHYLTGIAEFELRITVIGLELPFKPPREKQNSKIPSLTWSNQL
jgi:hypothetical protein